MVVEQRWQWNEEPTGMVKVGVVLYFLVERKLSLKTGPLPFFLGIIFCIKKQD